MIRLFPQRERFGAGRHLAEAHDRLRQELAELRDLIARVEAGTVNASLYEERVLAEPLSRFGHGMTAVG